MFIKKIHNLSTRDNFREEQFLHVRVTCQTPNTFLPDNSRNMFDTIDVIIAYFIAHFAITYDSGGNQ